MTNKKQTKNTKNSQKRYKVKKNSFSLTDSTTTLAIVSIIAFIISWKIMGLFFTLLLFVGIIIIIAGSMLINKITKKKKSKTVINTLIIIFLSLCILGTVVVGGFFLYIIKSAPEFDVKKLTYSESTLVYDCNNELIAELGAKKRENITYDEMSEVLIDAIIATEDSRFFQHNGFDAARFLRASLGQLVGNSGAGGASTLSMQVIKNSFTSSEASGLAGITRKFTDIYLSVFKLEKNYTKQEIIEFYANNHFLGSNAYGVEQASKTYFGKSASELNLAEASMIVGLFKAPTSYNPYTNPEAATSRRKTVLNLMYKHGYITKEERDLADSIPVESLLVGNKGDTLEFQGYIDTVVKEIQEKYKVNPYNTPMMIYTNMDKEKQTSINKIFSGETFNWENSYVQAGAAAVDVDTGKIIAIGNGRNRDVIDAYNFATDINRQIGSTAKPIVDYAPGMEYLNWSTYTIFNDSKYYYSSGQEIRNSDRGYMGNITLRTAIAQSRNIPALKAFQQVRDEIGLDAYQKFVESFGIKTEDYFHEAHSIGAFNGSNPLAMAAAYAVFANGGYYYEPYTVNKIIYRDTGEVIEYESEGKRIISDSTAFMITDTLVTAVQSGLSSGAKLSGYNIAAKTGTTNYDEETAKKLELPSNAIPDSWLIGYDSEISIGLWYGCEKASKTQYLKSTNAVVNRGKLFRAIAKEVLTKSNKFEVPNSVVKVAIEKGSNPAKLASDSTPKSQIVYEYFKKGTEPTETSIKYSKLNNVSNLNGEYNVSDMSMTLSWNPTSSKDTDSEEYGALGYKIYKDGNYLAFTTETTYTILNLTNPEGTYKVVTSYKNFSDNASSGATYTYKVQENNLFDAVLKYSSSSYSIGDTLATYDQNPSNADIIAYLNSEDITSEVTVSVIITDSNGTEVTLIDNTTASTYTVTYNIAYGKYSKTLSRTITIK